MLSVTSAQSPPAGPDPTGGRDGHYVAHPGPGSAGPRPSAHGLKSLVGLRGLRRLVFVRLLSSFGDGAFQGALAGVVLLDPTRQTSPGEIATAVTVLLLPYSVIGPFAGALLDRWSRRQVIIVANLVRAFVIAIIGVLLASGLPQWALFGLALIVTGAGRFVGSGLSASLPHLISADSLVGANSLATTAGSVATALGGGYALGLRILLGHHQFSAAYVTTSVIIFYLGSTLVVRRFASGALGPDETDEPAQPLRAVIQGFAAGFHHIVQRPTVGLNIAMVTLVRFCFGLATLLVLLLFRHHFVGHHGIFRSGMAGIAEVVGVSALGLLLGAVATAPMVALAGRTRYLIGLLTVAAVVVVISGTRFTQGSIMLATLILAFAYQSSKICADSVVQSDSDDAHIGRVFALYDTVNNVFYVAGFVVGVAVVPFDGLSPAAVITVGVIYLLTAAGYGVGMGRLRARPAGGQG